MNPKKGGSPPKERSTIKIDSFKNWFELNILNVWLILNNLKLLNIKIILKVKKV